MWPTNRNTRHRSEDSYNPPDDIDGSESSSFDDPALAPLAYLQAVPPPRRHPVDEKALMRLAYRP